MNKKRRALLDHADRLQEISNRRMVWWCLAMLVTTITAFGTLRIAVDGAWLLDWLLMLIAFSLLSLWPFARYVARPEQRAIRLRELAEKY